MLDFGGLNWLAIFTATAIAFALGGIWYGPLLGKAWMDAIGKTADEIEPSPAPFIISAFTAFLTSLVLAALIKSLGMEGLLDGVILGLVTGVGFIAAAMASDSAFCGWGLKLFCIQAGYRVTYSVLMGAVLGVWQ